MSEMKNWNEWKNEITTFMDNGAVEDWMITSVSTMLTKGDNDASRQTKFSSAIKSILEDVEGAPIGRRSSALNSIASATLAVATSDIKAFAEIFDNNPALQGLLLPHGRSEEVVFADGAAFVSHLSEQMKRNAVKSHKAGWDGEATSLVGFLQEAN
tara:strand:- start:334 stop:801 length:468 start_codon:yes stop_codon:yes gene_type:complete